MPARRTGFRPRAPDEAVSAAKWKDLSVGQIGDEVARDGEFVRIPLIVMDVAAIKAVDEGKRGRSAGYTCDLAWEAGTTPEGEKYDAGSTTSPSCGAAAPDHKFASATV